LYTGLSEVAVQDLVWSSTDSIFVLNFKNTSTHTKNLFNPLILWRTVCVAGWRTPNKKCMVRLFEKRTASCQPFWQTPTNRPQNKKGLVRPFFGDRFVRKEDDYILQRKPF
jgi:hypothetical protein